MNPNIGLSDTEVESSSSGSSEIETGAANLPEKDDKYLALTDRIEDLNRRAGGVESNFKVLEDRATKFQNFMLIIVGTIGLTFIFTSLFIALDYWKYNEERYENFVDKTQSFYTKVELDKIMTDFKNCIWFNGLSRCLR